MEENINWLCEQAPWVRYRTRIDLLDKSKDNPEVKRDYEELINHQLIKTLLQEIQEWPGQPMKRHNDAKLLFHKLVFLADLGISKDNPLVAQVIKKILASQSREGPFQIIGNIPTVFGGSGQDELIWMLCDAPLVTYALVKLGVNNDTNVQKSIDYLLSLIKDFGWPCAATTTLGKKFKGPGKRTDPCPYANLIMLKLISVIPELHNSHEAKKGAEVLLTLWEYRKEVKYFLFGMGTDFKKLKAPMIWYDILHVTDVLSHYKWTHNDKRFVDMIQLLQTHADENGRYKASSAWRAWKDWDFGQKKTASGWITFLVYRILRRIK